MMSGELQQHQVNRETDTVKQLPETITLCYNGNYFQIDLKKQFDRKEYCYELIINLINHD